MRNGDYLPTRLEAQSDCVNLLANAKTSQNPESTVGLITMAGRRVDVLQTLETDPTPLLSALNKVKPDGDSDVLAALMTAQLALKHRPNRNGGQRIVIFIGSPINCEKKRLVTAGKRLKKNGIALDVVSIGNEGNDELLNALHAAVNNKDETSHLVFVPVGTQFLSDALISTPIFFADAGGGGGGDVGGGGGGGGPGFDPNTDPELYAAIQASLAEQAERESISMAGAAVEGSSSSGGTGDVDPTTPMPGGSAPTDAEVPAPMDLDDELDDDMKAAIALSMQMEQGEDELYAAQPMDEGAGEEIDEDEAAALALSMQLAEQSQKEQELAESLKDESFVKSLFGGLPVDYDDAQVQEALKKLNGPGEEKEKDEGDDKEKK